MLKIILLTIISLTTISLPREAAAINSASVCIGGVPISYPAPENSPKADILAISQGEQTAKECYLPPTEDFNFNLALSGSFYHEDDTASLLKKFGAVSSLRGIKYWSISDDEWKTFIVDASALEGRDGPERSDFSADELRTGSEVYFSQQDNRSSGSVTYRMRVEKAEADRLMISITNVSPVNFLFVPVFSPGDIKAVYVLEKISGNQWGYFNFVGNNSSQQSSPDEQEKSSLNRAVAFYRHFTGIPTDQNPPFAP